MNCSTAENLQHTLKFQICSGD